MTDPFAEYVQNPDRRRLSRFIVAYTEPVTRLVRRVVPCPEASRDIVQDVFLRLAESDLTLEKIPYPRAYVLRAALNTARDHLREEKTRRRHEREAARLRTAASHPADEDVIAREAVERLYRDIDALPEPLRVAIHLRAVDGLSYREIALVTDVSVGIVGSRIQKARQKLSELSGGRGLAVAWANLELAREEGWFPAPTDGLSPAVLERLRTVAKPARMTIAPVALAGFVALSVLGVSTPWLLEGPQEMSQRDEVATAPRERRAVQASSAVSSFAAGETPGKPMAPVVPGAVTETSAAREEGPETQGPGESSTRESEGGGTMTGKNTLLASAALAVGMAAAVGGAETGDFDGDGKLTIRDVILARESRNAPDLQFAPGSLAAFTEYPPYVAASSPSSLHRDYISTSVYLESLRRTLSGPFPTYSFMHWPGTWLEDIEQEPLPEDPRVTVRLLPVETRGQHRIEVAMELTATAPVEAFSLAIESEEGMLRVPWVLVEQDDWRDMSMDKRWVDLKFMMRGDHDRGDVTVQVPPAGYLMSGGRYVVAYGLERGREHTPDLAPGTYRLLMHGRLPRGTKAGRYSLRILEASQVLLADGTLLSPTIAGGEGEIVVTEDIENGWEEGLPPLRFDVRNQRVLGKVEFRFADAAGDSVPEGQPVARGKPGDVVRFRVQVRTETPLNAIAFEFRWPQGLLCTFESKPLLEQGGEPVPDAPTGFGTCGNFSRTFQARFYLGGNWIPLGVPGSPPAVYTGLLDRPLEYFKPLDEWLDLYDVVVQIPDEPPLDVIPLEFLERDAVQSVAGDWVRAEFTPFRSEYFLWNYAGITKDSWPDRDLWEYDICFHNAFVLVEGAAPPEPPDHFIHFELEDVVVPPGGIVEVPVLARSADPLSRLRLALEVDPESITVEAVDTRLRNPETGLVSRVVRRRGEFGPTRSPDCPPAEEVDQACLPDCPPVAPCFGVPHSIRFWETEERYAVFDWTDLGVGGPYPGPEPAEIARLVIRAADNPASTEVQIRPTVVTIGDGPFAETYESGGIADIPSPVVPFSPAREVRGATVRIGRSGLFVRGDVNTDASLNLTDPVLLLEHLFAGGEEPECLDAGDADDNGQLQLTDAIYLLQWLFGSGDAPPPPRQCGEDPTQDEVPCDRNVCRRE